MTPIKFLSAGLIAVAMLAAPVAAREYAGANRHSVEATRERAPPRSVEGYAGIPGPQVGTVPATCDVGDNAHVC